MAQGREELGMVTLFEQEVGGQRRQSSKGNQLKWYSGKKWYKADYTGYEGLSEYVVSRLLSFSSLDQDMFIVYDTVRIQYGENCFLGCQSDHFLPAHWQLITLERLFWQYYGESLYQSVFHIREPESGVFDRTDRTNDGPQRVWQISEHHSDDRRAFFK